MSVKDRIALVTGGASGIGRASAKLPAAHGARVVIADRDGAGVAQARDEIVGAGGQAEIFAGDIGDAASTRDVARVMAAQKSGTMILLTSDRGVYGSIDYAHYAASKGGMIALTRSLALTLGKYGVTVNGVNPGLTDTPLARAANPQWEDKLGLDVLGTYSRPEEIAEIVLFLAGTAGAFMTGQIVSTRLRHGA